MGSEEYYNMMMIKGKRSKRQRQLHGSLALTMATSSSSTSSSDQQLDNNICMIRCNDDDDDKTTQVEQDMANCLILLAQGGQSRKIPTTTTTTIKDLFMYQCKTCDRSFPSFQALGGHRASHKRPKPGSTTEPLINQHESSSSLMFNHGSSTSVCTTNTILSLQISSSRPDSCGIKNISNGKSSSSKVHECSICGAEFTSGQALGGHMRRHRSSLLPRAAMPSPNHESADHNEMNKAAAAGGANVFCLDLNLPAPEDMDQQVESKFPFAINQQVIVFSPSALVDCHL